MRLPHHILCIFLLLLLSFPSYSQQKITKLQKEYGSLYLEFNSNNITLSGDKIEISRLGDNIYSESISGEKEVYFSPGSNALLICSFDFSLDRNDYEILIRAFDSDGRLLIKTNSAAPQGLPHPLFGVNDFGIIYSFNPLNFELKLISGESMKSLFLEKDIQMEMERNPFISSEGKVIMVVTSLRAPADAYTDNNVVMYKINSDDLSISRKAINFTVPICIYQDKDKLIISGMRIENRQPVFETILMENNSIINSIDIPFEKIIKSDKNYFCKFNNSLYRLDESLSIIKEFDFEDGLRVFDINKLNGSIAVLAAEITSNFLYVMNEDFSVALKLPVDEQVIPAHSRLRSEKDKLFLYSNSKTLIFN